MMRILVFLVIILTSMSHVHGQESNASEQDSSKARFKVIYAETHRGVRDGADFDRFLEGNVQIVKDSSFIYCDGARLNDKLLKAWGDFSMIKADSIKLFTDSIHYDIETQLAKLKGSVLIHHGKQILFSDNIRYDDARDIAYYTDKAILRDSTLELKSKRGSFHIQDNMAYFSQQVSVIDSLFKLYADTLKFNTALRKAIFQGPTNIIMDTVQVYCEAGYFLTEAQYGVFKQNARYTGKQDTATADSIKVNGKTNEIILAGNAQYTSSSMQAKGAYIYYNTDSGQVQIKGKGYVKDGSRIVEGEDFEYNRKTGTFSSKGRSTMVDGSSIFSADDVASEDGIGIAKGQVEWIDTLNNIRIDSDFLEFDQNNKMNNKAYGAELKPLLSIEMNRGDTLFICPDTLHSFQQVTLDSIVRFDQDSVRTVEFQQDTTDFLIAYYYVQLYSEDFQGVCDSLVFNTKDSILTMYQQPILWSDTSQFKGDTIVMRFDQSKLKEIDLFPNSFILNSPDEIFFNQIKGKRTQAFFEAGKIDSMIVTGNAQSVYYLQDEDKAYVGVNTTVCSNMTFLFDDQLKDILFNKEPESKLYPMDQVDHTSIRLEGYSWDAKKRPMDVKTIRKRIAKQTILSTEDENIEVIKNKE